MCALNNYTYLGLINKETGIFIISVISYKANNIKNTLHMHINNMDTMLSIFLMTAIFAVLLLHLC